MTRRAARLALLSAWALATVAAWAQPIPATVPDPGAQRALERGQVERARQDERLERARPKPSVQVPPDGGERARSAERNLPVRRIEVDPSAILDAAALRAAVAPFEGRLLSLDELQQAVDVIDRLYDDKGVPTARAVLPPQELVDGVVRIRLVEARLGSVLPGPTRLGPSRVVQRLGLQPGEIVSVRRIEAALQRFNRMNEVQLGGELLPGLAAGTTDLVLLATDPPWAQWSAFTDNAGSPALGGNRLGMAVRLPLLGERGDSLSAQLVATGAHGSVSAGLGWILPLPGERRFDLSISAGRTLVVRGPFAALGVRGRSADVSAGLVQSWPTAYGVTTAGLRMALRESVSTVGGLAQPRQRAATLALVASGELQQDRASSTFDMALLYGHLGSATGAGSANPKEYAVLRASAAQLLALGDARQLLLRAGAQYTPTEALPSDERFAIGGVSTVRGHPEGADSGTIGRTAGLELRQRLAPTCDLACGATLLAFVDHGRVSGAATGGRVERNSAGLGAVLNFGVAQLRVHHAWAVGARGADGGRSLGASLSARWP